MKSAQPSILRFRNRLATHKEAKMKRIATSLFFLQIIIVLALAGSGEKLMTVENSLAIKQAGAPQLSPDGKWVAYTISEWDRKENTRVSHVWLASTSGGRSTKLTNGLK